MRTVARESRIAVAMSSGSERIRTTSAYDVGMAHSGIASAWDEVVFRGDPAWREFIAFWLQERRVVAGGNVNGLARRGRDPHAPAAM